MIIGLSGKMGTGKSTIAGHVAHILRQGGERVEMISFSLLLKQECARRFNFALDYTMSQEGKAQIIFHPDLPSGSMSVRRILQWWGTDVCRKSNPDHWVNIMSVLVDGIKSGTMIIIDDIRFPNEADFVLDRGGFLVRVHPYMGWEPGPDAGHKSETILDEWEGIQGGWWHFEAFPEYGKESLFNAGYQVACALRQWQELIR